MKKTRSKNRRGVVLILSMIFVVVLSTLSVSMFTMSSANAQMANNHRQGNQALNAAYSGLEIAKHMASEAGNVDVVLNYASYKSGNFETQADALWTALSKNELLSFNGTEGALNYIETENFSYCDLPVTFKVRFVREDSNTIKAVCTGTIGELVRTVGMTFNVQKNNDEILNYGLAGRGRMWITGDTTIHGNIYSSWNNSDVSPFNITEDSKVMGTVNTILTKNTVDSESWKLETLDFDDNAMFEYGVDIYDSEGNVVVEDYGIANDGYLVDVSGNPVFDADGKPVPVDYANRIYNDNDELLGYHEEVGYGVEKNSIDTYLDIDSYDTDVYKDRVMNEGNGNIPSSSKIVTEYFPHGPDGYDDYKRGSRTVKRHVYENVTFNDVRLPDNRNALFKNCTFENVLYIDCYKSTSSYYNNVRFEDCTFNGVIATDTPSSLKWQYNALYFTGSANFNNTSDIQEATIMAPHFNVNLGDANNGEVKSDKNVITGAVVGGIVDIRGNAEILGTVISMCDTSQWTSGYVTNIGATLGDGGSETTTINDVGTINITPDPDQSLFPGLKEYPCTLFLQADNSTYYESN